MIYNDQMEDFNNEMPLQDNPSFIAVNEKKW